MERRDTIVEKYGPLSGIRVLMFGHAQAAPCAGRWLSDMGAEVIKVERPGMGDMSRAGVRQQRGEHSIVPKWISLARNVYSVEMELDFEKYPDAKEVFIDLVKQSDIWINSLIGIDKRGPSDELALEANPKLTIVEISGYGLARNGGIDELLGKSCLDAIGQAFSGLASMQGMPDGPVTIMNPAMGDEITAMTATVAALSGYINAQKTGKGQVIDVSMYESMAHALCFNWLMSLNGQGPYKRCGNIHQQYQPFGYFDCKEGRICLGVLGKPLWTKLIKAIDATEEEFPYVECCIQSDPELAAKFRAYWYKWISEHTADEVYKIMNSGNIPCSKVLTLEQAGEHPHYLSRHDFIEIKDEISGEMFTDLAPMPKFSDTPSKVWRGGPRLGQDTDEILSKVLGYSAQKIEALKSSGTVAASNKNV